MTMSLSEIAAVLENVRLRRAGEAEAIASAISAAKASAVAARDQHTAKRLWCMAETLAAQEAYLRAFVQLKEGRYFDG